jgi:hypothetical protein
MSCNSYGYVIVGVKVRNKLLESVLEDIRKSKDTKVKGCKHKYENAKFCPECGKPKFVVKESDEIDSEEWISDNKLEFVTSTDRTDWFLTTDKKWIGQSEDINCGVTYESIPFPTSDDLREIVEELKAKLEPYSLWDASQFRLWVVGFCSY